MPPSRSTQPFEQIRAGDRVLATSDDPNAGRATFRDFSLVRVSLPNPEGPGRVDIEALRPADSVAQFLPGDLLPIDYREFGVVGYARIESVTQAPRIAPGCGRLVTATISRIALDVLRLSTEGCDKPIEISSGHRVFSIDRADWVPTASLTVGERIRTGSGASAVSEITPVGRPVRVYNLEVDGDHCYFAGPIGLLSHNGAICSRIEGVYKVRTTDGRTYVGQTGKGIWSRLKAHIRKGKITREAAEAAEWIDVPGGLQERRRIEQREIKNLDGPRSDRCANQRNEIAPGQPGNMVGLD